MTVPKTEFRGKTSCGSAATAQKKNKKKNRAEWQFCSEDNNIRLWHWTESVTVNGHVPLVLARTQSSSGWHWPPGFRVSLIYGVKFVCGSKSKTSSYIWLPQNDIVWQVPTCGPSSWLHFSLQKARIRNHKMTNSDPCRVTIYKRLGCFRHRWQ